MTGAALFEASPDIDFSAWEQEFGPQGVPRSETIYAYLGQFGILETLSPDYGVAQLPDLTATIPETITRARSPESEIYGRSLSTPYGFGVSMPGKTWAEIITSPEAAQTKVEFFTSVQEGFGTDKELGGGLEVRDFDLRPVLNGRVMSKDLKTAISDMTAAGLACAVETAKKDERFRPQLTRSEWDHENALIVDQMVRGETPYTTRIVISPFPEEAAAASGDPYWRGIGYVPSLRRGFVQLYHVTKEGKLLSGSLSFDGSNKQRIWELFGKFGVNISPDETTDDSLKYAITRTLSDEEAKAVATEIANEAGDPALKKNTNTVDVTERYGPIMERVFNESYVHICKSLAQGYQTEETRQLILQFAGNAHHFNERYSSALYRMRAGGESFTDDDFIALHDLLVYSTIEMMRALHLNNAGSHYDPNGGKYGNAQSVAAYLQSTNSASFQHMLGNFGADGAINNRGYSACGIEIFAGGKDAENNPQSAFGGADRAGDSDDLGSRWFLCPKGHLNYRTVANVKEKKCHACWINVSCEAPKPKNHKAANQPSWHEHTPNKAKASNNRNARLGGRALQAVGNHR